MGLINKTTVYINPTTTTRFNPDGKDDKARFNYDGTDARQTIFGFLSSIKFVPSASETSPPPSDTSLGNRDGKVKKLTQHKSLRGRATRVKGCSSLMIHHDCQNVGITL